MKKSCIVRLYINLMCPYHPFQLLFNIKVRVQYGHIISPEDMGERNNLNPVLLSSELKIQHELDGAFEFETIDPYGAIHTRLNHSQRKKANTFFSVLCVDFFLTCF